MPIDTQDVIELASRLVNEDGIKVTVKQSMKAGLMAGGGAMIGGLLGGPVGVLIGGVAASCWAATTLGDFQPLHQVIQQLPDNEKNALADAVRRSVENIDMYDITYLSALVLGNTSIRMQIIKAVIAFVQSELRMQIVD